MCMSVYGIDLLQKKTYLWYKTVTIYVYIKESIKINY